MSDAIEAAIEALCEYGWAGITYDGYRFPMGNLREGMQDAIAAYREAQWQPIETAPKDGTHVMLSRGDRVTLGNWESVISTSAEYHANGTYLGQFEDGNSWEGWMSWDGGFCEETPPTHWMPLPEPPKEAK